MGVERAATAGSLGDMIRAEMGPAAGTIALIGVLIIMVILLAVLALVVVKALAHSPWGTFTVFATMPNRDLHGHTKQPLPASRARSAKCRSSGKFSGLLMGCVPAP